LHQRGSKLLHNNGERNMIVIRIILNVNPKDCALFVERMTADVAVSRTLPGCVRFELLRDVADEHRFFLYEEWQDMASFDAYRNRDEFKRAGQNVFPLLSAKHDSVYYAAEKVN
jgi:quinol monooxygenase YgiN